MPRILAPLIAAVAVTALAAGRADACSMQFVDMFTRWDGAATVAEVEVTAIDADGAVTLERRSTLKGDKTQALTGRQGGMCPPNYEQGEKAIAFVDGTGLATWIEADAKRIRSLLGAWKAAKTAAARTKLLRKWARSKDETTKLHATERIAHDAATWTAPGSAAAAQARLVALWPSIKSGANTAAASALAVFDDPMAKGTCRAGSAESAATAAQGVRDTMGKHDPAVAGSLAALDALGTGKVWNVSCGVGFDTLFAYISAADGALVMVWLPPEG